MSPKRTAEDPVRQETERLMEMLRIFIRCLGYGNVEIARQTGIAHANVGRYLRGEVRVPLYFVLAAIRALGLSYGEFFELAYADQRPEEPSETRQRIERLLQILPARKETTAPRPDTSRPEQKPPPPRPDIEKILDALQRELEAWRDGRRTD